MTDINFSTVKVDGNNKPVFIAANIKYDPLSHLISGGECFPKVRKVTEFGVMDDFVPAQ